MTSPGVLRAEGRPQDETGRRGSNPPPPGWHPGALPPMSYCRRGGAGGSRTRVHRTRIGAATTVPECAARGCRLAGSSGPEESGRRGFLRCQRSLPAVSGSLPAVHRCFWCRAAAVRPRVPSLVAVTLGQTDRLRRRERERRCRRLLGCPVSRVWATLVATIDPSGLCRNLSAPRNQSWSVAGWWRGWDSNPRNDPKVLRLMRPASTPLLRPASLSMLSGGRVPNPLLQDGILALCQGELPPQDRAGQPWWGGPAGGTPCLPRRGVGFSLLGAASAAASAAHARPCATFVWSGGRGSNPLRLLGRQEFYRMNYRRY